MAVDKKRKNCFFLLVVMVVGLQRGGSGGWVVMVDAIGLTRYALSPIRVVYKEGNNNNKTCV